MTLNLEKTNSIPVERINDKIHYTDVFERIKILVRQAAITAPLFFLITTTDVHNMAI